MKKNLTPVSIAAIADAIAMTTDKPLSNLFLSAHNLKGGGDRDRGELPVVECFVSSIGEAIAVDGATELIKHRFGVELAILIKDRRNEWVRYPYIDCNYPKESGISPKPLLSCSLE
jgi:hypothetical protein